jgi:hypothetical protein
MFYDYQQTDIGYGHEHPINVAEQKLIKIWWKFNEKSMKNDHSLLVRKCRCLRKKGSYSYEVG